MLVLVSYKFPENQEYAGVVKTLENVLRGQWRFSSYNTIVIPANTPEQAVNSFTDVLYQSLGKSLKNNEVDTQTIERFLGAIGQVDIAVYAGEIKLSFQNFNEKTGTK